MTVTVNKREIALAERFTLTVEVVASRGADVELPRFDGPQSGPAIRGYCEHPSQSFERGCRWRLEYHLDAFLSGQCTIPRMTARFIDRQMGTPLPVEAEVTVKEFVVTVRSPVEANLDPRESRAIKGPVPLPLDRSWAWGNSSGLAGVLAVTLVVIWVIHHGSREAPGAVTSPEQWALGQLRNLTDEQLVERGLLHQSHFRLSMIVRRYIEQRFDVTALRRPLTSSCWRPKAVPKLPADFHATIGSFLRAWDMVKFALDTPHANEINGALNTARDFVDQSADNDSEWMTAA